MVKRSYRYFSWHSYPNFRQIPPIASVIIRLVSKIFPCFSVKNPIKSIHSVESTGIPQKAQNGRSSYGPVHLPFCSIHFDGHTVTNNYRVAPNPFRNQTLVSWNNLDNQIYQAQLVNVTGQVVRKYANIVGESLLVEKEALFPGIYFLNIIDGAGNFGTVKLLLLE